MSDQAVKVYIVDDDEAIRDSLRWLLEAKGFLVETYASAEQFLATYRWDYPGCLILDVRMPGMTGLELYEKLTSLNYCLPVVFVTGHGDVPMAVNAVKMGAVDFIEKPFEDQKLVDLIQRCLVLDAQCRSRVHKSTAIRACLEQLTPREREVMDQVVTGQHNKIIADRLGISIKTVEAHRARVMEKMGAKSVADLVQLVLYKDGVKSSAPEQS